jgi:phosphoglycolate phosphatase-like HAD superfamily hydrolase
MFMHPENSPLRIKGIVFDMDGTLVNLGGHVDWKHAYHQAKGAFLRCGCPPGLIEGLKEKNLFNMLNIVRDENARSMDEETMRDIQKDAYSAVEECELEGIKHCSLMPDCVSTLSWIQSQGISMGVATSNSELVAEKVLELKGIRGFFSSVVGRRPELRMKPYSDQSLKCLEEMGVDPSHGLIVGDSIKDIQSAKSADIPMISIPSSFTNREDIERLGTEETIGSLGDLPAVIERLNGLR